LDNIYHERQHDVWLSSTNCLASARRGSMYGSNVRALETDKKTSIWRCFLTCFAASANKTYFNWQHRSILFILQCQKVQNNWQILLKTIGTCAFPIVFVFTSTLYSYRFLHASCPWRLLFVYLVYTIKQKFIFHYCAANIMI